MAPHSSTLAWKIPWLEEPGRLQSMRLLSWATSLWFSLSCIGEGNGNPLQCSCLENPRDGGASWAAVYGVTQSQTRLKRLNSSSSQEPAPGHWSLEADLSFPVKSQMTAASWAITSWNTKPRYPWIPSWHKLWEYILIAVLNYWILK